MSFCLLANRNSWWSLTWNLSRCLIKFKMMGTLQVAVLLLVVLTVKCFHTRLLMPRQFPMRCVHGQEETVEWNRDWWRGLGCLTDISVNIRTNIGLNWLYTDDKYRCSSGGFTCKHTVCEPLGPMLSRRERICFLLRCRSGAPDFARGGMDRIGKLKPHGLAFLWILAVG